MCKYNDINIYRGTVMKIENGLPKVIDENEQLYFDDIDDIFYGFNSYGNNSDNKITPAQAALYLADLDGNIFNRDEYERYLKVYKNGILHYGDINDFKEGDFFVLSSSLHHDEEAEKHAYEMGFRPKPRR